MDKKETANPKEVIDALLARGDAMLCVDSRHPQVEVPENHRNRPDLRLILNLGFRNPIHVLEEGVRADLVFGGVRYSCWFPYESLWGVYNPHTMEGMVWPGRMPEELTRQTESGIRMERGTCTHPKQPAAAPARRGPAQSGRRKRASLRVIHGGKG